MIISKKYRLNFGHRMIKQDANREHLLKGAECVSPADPQHSRSGHCERARPLTRDPFSAPNPTVAPQRTGFTRRKTPVYPGLAQPFVSESDAFHVIVKGQAHYTRSQKFDEFLERICMVVVE